MGLEGKSGRQADFENLQPLLAVRYTGIVLRIVFARFTFSSSIALDILVWHCRWDIRSAVLCIYIYTSRQLARLSEWQYYYGGGVLEGNGKKDGYGADKK